MKHHNLYLRNRTKCVIMYAKGSENMTPKEIGEMIKTRRLARGMTQGQLAEAAGVSESTIAMYEQGRRKPKDHIVEALADVFNVPKWAVLYSEDELEAVTSVPNNIIPISELRQQRVPMIGEVAAGEPIYGEEIGLFVNSPIECDAAVTIRGESMVPTYLPGDVVYIKCVEDVPEGAVAVVFLDDEATIKHVYKRKTGLTLWSDNPEYLPMQIEFEDYNRVRIFGVPVGFTRIYKPEIASKIRKGFH